MSFPDLEVSCAHSEADFYVCDSVGSSHFIGCCTSYPCNVGCPFSDLWASTFDADTDVSIPPQVCVEDIYDWYTCYNIEEPFFGCCAVNPCEVGECDGGDIREARLRLDGEDVVEENSEGPPTIDTSSGGLSNGAVAGLAIGLTLGVVLILGLLHFWYARRTKKAREGPPVQELNQPQYSHEGKSPSPYGPTSPDFSTIAGPESQDAHAPSELAVSQDSRTLNTRQVSRKPLGP